MTKGESVRKQLHVGSAPYESQSTSMIWSCWRSPESRRLSSRASNVCSAQCGASGYRDGAIAQHFAVAQFIALNTPPPFFKLFERSSYTNTKKES